MEEPAELILGSPRFWAFLVFIILPPGDTYVAQYLRVPFQACSGLYVTLSTSDGLPVTGEFNLAWTVEYDERYYCSLGGRYYYTTMASLRSEKDRQNIDFYREFIWTFTRK